MGAGRVLIIDGEPNARLALRELLAEEGYEVMTAGSALEGVDVAAGFRPHVALVDSKITRGDSDTLRKRLAAVGSTPSVVLMWARDPPRSDGETLSLRKPVNLVELFTTIATAAERALRDGRGD